MSDSNNPAASAFLRGISWLLFAAGGLCFWAGGRAISEFTKTDRILAEMEGIGLTIVFVGLGAVAKSYADRIDETEEEPNHMYDADSGRKS